MKAEDLRGQDFVLGQAPQGATTDTPAARALISGAMVRHSLGEGQVILPDDVLRPGDHGFLATVLDRGMRAMTFNVADVTTDWSLIWPGDHVDIILTQQFDDAGANPRHRIAAETIIHEARVVAVDRQLVQGETADDADHKTSRTLTVELSSADSERLVVAQRLGKNTLALCAAAPAAPPAVTTAALTPGAGAPVRLSDAAPADTTTQGSTALAQDPVTWGGDVAHALDQPPPPEPIVVRIFRGSEDGKEFKF